MIERIRIIMLTMTCICVFSDQNHAGVITVEGDKVTKATLSDGTTNYNVQFVFAFYIYNENALPNQEIMPWFSDPDKAEQLAEDLAEAINNYEQAATQLDTEPYYLFTYEIYPNNTTLGNALVYDFDPWKADTINTEIDRASSDNSNPYFYAILDTSVSSSVPEPSTAIAMGLLGIVGFAGNRRRRRQVSVA